MKKRILSLLLLVALLLSFTSCIGVRANELSAGYEKRDSGVKAAHNEGFYADFSVKLLNGAAKKGKNALVSPLSATVALALLANGLGGESLSQTERATGLTLDGLNAEALYLSQSLKTGDKCKIRLANSLWFEDMFKTSVKSAYLQKNADLFGAQIYAAPFDSSTVSDINKWCSKNTDGMINKIIDGFPENTVLMGINALVFDAEWRAKYEKNDIKKLIFHNYDGTEKETDFLCSDEQLLYGDGYAGFYKMYEGDNYCFTAILPDKDVYEFASELTGEKLNKMWSEHNHGSVSVKLPEFAFDGEADLKEIFGNMGMTDVFDREKADMSNLSDTDCYISAFEQKTRIELDRNGTKAAAISFFPGAGMAAPPPEEIIFDRPFLFTITDVSNGIPLFIGIAANL